MLRTTRKEGETFTVGDVKIRIIEAGRGQVRLEIDAPPEVPIHCGTPRKTAEPVVALPAPIAGL